MASLSPVFSCLSSVNCASSCLYAWSFSVITVLTAYCSINSCAHLRNSLPLSECAWMPSIMRSGWVIRLRTRSTRNSLLCCWRSSSVLTPQFAQLRPSNSSEFLSMILYAARAVSPVALQATGNVVIIDLPSPMNGTLMFLNLLCTISSFSSFILIFLCLWAVLPSTPLYQDRSLSFTVAGLKMKPDGFLDQAVFSACET